MNELREIQTKRAELNERRVIAEDQLRRIDVRAPPAVEVITPPIVCTFIWCTMSEPVMLIVPEEDALIIEAKVAPPNIDHVRSGQTAFIRLPAFNQRTTPEFLGAVHRVGADLIKNQNSIRPLCHAHLTLPDAQARSWHAGRGTHQNAERTALSDLMKPLTDQIARAIHGAVGAIGDQE